MRVFTSLLALAALVGIVSASAYPTGPATTTPATPPATANTAGVKKPHGYAATDADKKWANDQIALLKALTCCKNHKCGHDSAIHKVFVAMEAPGLSKYPLGLLRTKLRIMFKLQGGKKGATPPTTPPTGAGKVHHQSPEYQLMLVKMTNVTLHTMAHAKNYPPKGAHSIKHVHRLIRLLKFKNPSLKPGTPDGQKAIAKSVLHHIKDDAFSRRMVLKYKFETALDAALGALKKTGTKTPDVVHTDLQAALDAILKQVNDKRAAAKPPKPAVVLSKAGGAGAKAPATGAPLPTPPGTPAPVGGK